MGSMMSILVGKVYSFIAEIAFSVDCEDCNFCSEKIVNVKRVALVNDYLEEERLYCMVWLARSPNLDPIHLWDAVRRTFAFRQLPPRPHSSCAKMGPFGRMEIAATIVDQ
ncbi:hypothetical protein TNCV_868441 [Trichonephila clavipes]|nr:hypothetical protein TNCV_868441 [Trichonephila clavipes]